MLRTTQQSLSVALEILQEQQELRELGLTEEEIEGYLEFYLETFELVTIGKDN